MANGKAHEKVNLFFLAIGIGVALVASQHYIHGVSVIVGYIFGTYLMNPDLDLKSLPYRRWGILKFIWLPYQTFKHRSIWTHGYIIGDIIRYAYLATWIVLGAYIASFITGVPKTYYVDHLYALAAQFKAPILSLVIGNMLSSAAHILTDHTSSTLKKIF